MKKLLNRFKITPKRTKETSSSAKYYDAVIHIGAPKTGSSAIQKFLLENRAILALNGYYYPEHGLDENGVSGGHSELGLSLINNDIEKAQTIFNDYIAQAKEKELILLISAESLFNHHEKLHALTKNYRCKIVSFFREPLEALFSNYNQSVKRHFNTTHISHICKNVLINNGLGNSSTYGKWIDSFGKENMTILEYNLEYFKKHSIQEVFLTHIGLDTKTIKQIKPKEFQQINKSYTLAELEFKRVLNQVLDKENKKENNEIDRVLQKLSDAKQENRTLINELSTDTHDKLYNKFEEVREKLVEYGMVSFSKTAPIKKDHQQNKYLYRKKMNDILDIVEYFKEKKPEIHRYLVSKILEHAQNQKKLSCEITSLTEWFDIVSEILPSRKEPWFSQAQLNNMANGKYKELFFLKDIAVLLLQKGDIENADKIITKALEIRPNGPAIIKLKQTITEQMEQK